MASEEERAKILAEYLAETNNGDAEEEEEEFQSDDDDDDEYQGNKVSSINCPVLQGRFKLNGEQHLLYLGTWCMKHDLDQPKNARSKNNTFKLKSIQQMDPKTFTLANPISGETSSTAKSKKIVMNGFFHTDHTDQVQPHRKIKEKGVELVLTTEASSGNSYQVKGTGKNEFGAFHLKGTYAPSAKEKTHWLQCEKFYGGIPQSDEDDEIDSEDEQNDPQELDELQDDAELTVEELQKKYYGAASGTTPPTPPKAKSERGKEGRSERLSKRNRIGETSDDGESKPSSTKKTKVEANPNKKPVKKIVVKEDGDDDDDDDCGF